MLEQPTKPLTGPIETMRDDLRAERRAKVSYPPGETSFSMKRTNAFMTEPLELLLDAYERFGPVFTMRVFHHNVVFMIGPEANHFMLVSNADKFNWRDGHMRDLIPLLGDGLLTTDGNYHRAHRKMMLPTFHSERIRAATSTMEDEIAKAVDQLQPGQSLDIYEWTKTVALRVAMRALFGLDPDKAQGDDLDAAHEFETALSFHAHSVPGQLARGPGTAYSRLVKARKRLDKLIYSEIDRRRKSGQRGDDILSLLLDTRDEDGDPLASEQIRDEVMTLLFAGHDTTASTTTFLFYELALRPEILHAPGVTPEMLREETLRKYPPAWVGPRRTNEQFEFAGHTVPAGAHCQYSSWVSHNLPDVWTDPASFDPYRFTSEGMAAMQKGQYVPFGGGSRTCIGMRFGEAEIGVFIRRLLERFRFELDPAYELEIRTAPTISPRRGMPMTVRSAEPAPVLVNTERPEAAPAGA